MTFIPADRVLVVDDEGDVRIILRLVLECEGFEVTAVSSAEAAIDALRQDTFSAAIVDVMMPERDGFDLLTEIRGDEKWANLPVVLLSARASDRDIWMGWSAGADSYVTKPFDPEALAESVRSLLAERASLLRESIFL